MELYFCYSRLPTFQPTRFRSSELKDVYLKSRFTCELLRLERSAPSKPFALSVQPDDKELEELTRGVDDAIAELESCFPEGQKWLVPAVPGVDQEVGSLADVRCAQKLIMLRPTPYDIEGAEFQVCNRALVCFV